jgi:hypothetical protein
MMCAHEVSGRSAAASSRWSLRLLATSVLRTALTVIVGSGACAPFSMGGLTLAFFFFAAPLGLLLGLTYGFPVILVVGVWLSFQRPGPDPHRFVRTLQVVGAGIAVAVSGTTNLRFVGGVARSVTASSWDLLVAGTLAVVLVEVSGAIGWICGSVLAQRHLEAIDHPAAPVRRAARRRRPWR